MLKTTHANYIVNTPYDTLRFTYGVCPKHDNRPTYKRLLVECLKDGEVIHTVIHLVQCQTNCRSPYMVLNDIPFALNIIDRLDYPPANVEIVICDLTSYLIATKQRYVASLGERTKLKALWNRLRKVDAKVTIILGGSEFSHELTEYIEGLVAKNKRIVPTFERMGYIDRRHMAAVTTARENLHLWK